MSLKAHTMPLATPITLGSQTLEELVFQPVQAKHLMKCENNMDDKIKYMIELTGYLTGQTPQMIGELGIVDTLVAVGISSAFFSGSQPTGNELSE